MSGNILKLMLSLLASCHPQSTMPPRPHQTKILGPGKMKLKKKDLEVIITDVKL